ncbi:hypothetical protein ACPCTO_03175 [Streptomyces olivoreticuli]
MPAINPIPDTLVLPVGATSGQRIVLDGAGGQILMYDAGNNLIAEITPAVGIVSVTGQFVAQLVNGAANFQTGNTRFFGFVEEREVLVNGTTQHALALGVVDKQTSTENDFLITLDDSDTQQVMIPGALLNNATTWQPLTLASGITANTSLTPAVQTLPDGTAILRGNIKSSGSLASGAVLATLPAAATPLNTDYYGTVCSIGAGPSATYLTIQNNGQIVYRGNTGTLGYLFLGGLRFPYLI